MNFTSHNIQLDNGTKTLGDNQILLADSAVWTSLEKTVNLFFQETKDERKNLRVVDLGCLEGGYAVQFARLGFESIGIEAREENISKCNFVKANLNLPNLNFIQDDARNLPAYGKFDITFCSGLLYHLNDPVNFINVLSNCTNKLLLLNTHFAPEFDIKYDLGMLNKFIAAVQKRAKFLEYQKNYQLSKISSHEGYRGRWFKEWNENERKDKIEKMLWASYNNSQSFWLCKKDLTIALHKAGFNSVFEQFDFTGDTMPDNYTQMHNRTLFVAIKHK